MKRSIALLAAGILLCGLTACGNNSSPIPSSSQTPSSAISSDAPAQDVTYTISVDVLGEGGKKGIGIALVDKDDKVVSSATTARGGKATLTAPEGEYAVKAIDLKPGYFQSAELKTSKGATEYTVNIATRLAEGTPAKGTVFYKGDVLFDHTFEMVDGTEVKLSEQLATYKAVIINFWGIGCGACCLELPELNAYYEEMKEKVGLVCVNSFSNDTVEEIKEFISENEYSVPSTKFDRSYSNELNISGWPTTVIVDRYGRYAGGMVGFSEGVENFFHNMVDKYLADDYVPAY